MTANQIVSQIRGWLFDAVSILLLVALAVTALKLFGVALPIRSVGHVELAYLSGAYLALRWK